jgi:hypothetical protein
MTDLYINTVTVGTGAVIKPGPMICAPPSLILTDEQLAAGAVDTGLNAAFVADLLAACITHERDGVNLFRMLGATTNNPALQANYEKLTSESEQAVALWAGLIRELGGTEQYVSPAARLTEGMDSKMVEAFQGAGSADPLSLEMAGVQATLMAATICVAHTQALTKLAEDAQGPAQPAMARAAEQLTAMATKHQEQASATLLSMTLMQAKHPLVHKVGQAVEGAVAKMKNAMH